MARPRFDEVDEPLEGMPPSEEQQELTDEPVTQGAPPPEMEAERERLESMLFTDEPGEDPSGADDAVAPRQGMARWMKVALGLAVPAAAMMFPVRSQVEGAVVVSAADARPVVAQLGGKILKLKVSEGEKVTQGAVLAELESESSRKRLDALQGELKRAQKDFNALKGKRELKKLTAARQKAEAAKAAADKAKEAVAALKSRKASRAKLKAAQKKLAKANGAAKKAGKVVAKLQKPSWVKKWDRASEQVKTLEAERASLMVGVSSTLVAPTGGIVKNLKPAGMVLKPGEAAGQVVAADAIEVTASFDGRHADKLQAGQAAQLFLEGQPAARVMTLGDLMAAEADAAGQPQIRSVVRLESPEGTPAPGTQGRVRVAGARQPLLMKLLGK
jgi:multidrug resistance efflux pump